MQDDVARAHRWILAPLAFGAAAIHLALVPAHAEEWLALGIAFAFCAWVQFAVAVLLAVRPSWRVVAVGMAVSVLAIGAWGVTRTVGFPFGPDAGSVEEVGLVDLLCVAFEILFVFAGGLALFGFLRLRATALAVAVLPIVAVLGMTTAVLASPAGEHEHGHDEGHEHAEGEAHEHEHTDVDTIAAEGETHSHTESTDSGHVHGEPCTDPVTADQQAAADELVTTTRAGLEHYEDFAVAEAEGYVHITPDDRPLVHYARYDRMTDGKILDPDAPESLMYFRPRNGGDPVLVGAMYFAEPGEPGPEIGGCLTTWHVHDNLCIAPGQGMVGVVDAAGNCPQGSRNDVTQEMLHVWDIDLPTGPFSELAEADRAEIAVAVIRKMADRI